MIRATNQRALAMDGLTVITSRVDGFEGFRDAVHGSHVDVMQLQRGRFRGLLTHIGVGDFSLSVGSFSVGLRTQRTSSDPKLIVGMLLGAESRVTHWSYDMDPGDVLVIPPGVDHDGRFHGAASYAALRFDLADVTGAFGGESWMSDPANWRRKYRYRADPHIGAEAVAKLRAIVSRLSDPDARVSPEAAEFWRRAIIDVVTATVMHSQPPGTTETIPSATPTDPECRALHRNRRLAARAYFGNLRRVRRVPPQPSSRVRRCARHRSGHLPPAQAAMRHPFGTSSRRSSHDDDRGNRPATWLPQSRTVFRLLSAHCSTSTRRRRSAKFIPAGTGCGRPGPPLLRALHCRLLGRRLRRAEIMRGVDQRDMRQRPRKIAGLASCADVWDSQPAPAINPGIVPFNVYC
jgi:hypothetical protein